jgi:hypothetical protein
MEYFTTPEQEEIFRERYRQRLATAQDRIRLSRGAPGSPRQEIQEEDRRFFVESEGVFLGEARSGTECPLIRMEGGGTYEVDPIFLQEVQSFVQRHPRYMIVFQLRRGYSRRAGVYPAQMIAEDEELCLEDVVLP